MKIKRAIALFLASAILLVSASCTDSPPETSIDQTSGVSETESIQENAFSRYETEVLIRQGRDSSHPAGAGWILDDNEIADVISEVLNVKLINEWELTGEEYTQKVQLSIATGDLPDIMIVNDWALVREMFEKGLIEDLTATQDYFSDRLKDIYASYTDNRNLASVTFDGKLSAIPSTNLDGQHEILWVRRDWVEELGLDMPRTLDDVLEMAQAFVEQDPNNTNRDDTIGIPLLSDLIGVHNDLYTVDPILAIYNAFPRKFLFDNNGNIVYGSTTSEMKSALTRITELVRSGLITLDPDMGDVLALNECGMLFGPWWSVWSHMWGSRQSNRQADWIPISAPLNDDGKLIDVYPEANSSYLVVKKGYAYPEAAIKVLNIIYGLYNQDFDILELAPYEELNKDLPQNFMAWPIPLQLERADLLLAQSQRLQQALDDNSDEVLLPTEKRVFENMENYFLDKVQCSTTDWAETVAKLKGTREAFKDFEGIVPAIQHLTPQMSEIYAPLLEMEIEIFQEILRGEKPIDAFDQFVTQWKSMGGDELILLMEEMN